MTQTVLPENTPDFRARGPRIAGISALLVLLIGLGGWSTIARLSGAIVASGAVEVQSNRQVVQHPEGGVVGEIFVRDGDLIEAGQLLVALDGTFMQSEMNLIEGQLFEILARKSRLEAERDGDQNIRLTAELEQLTTQYDWVQAHVDRQQRLFEARRNTLQSQRAQLTEQVAQTESQIRGTDAQLSATRGQLELINAELTDQRLLLEKGLTPASRVSALERETIGLRGNIGRLEAELARLRGQIAGTEIEILRLTSGRREEAITLLQDQQVREAELSERRIALTEHLARLDIRAPVDGIIWGSQVFAVQSVIQPAEPLMHIVPQDAPLLISARVDATQIDQLYIGQDVTLRFPAFNQRLTPELFGTVMNISADVFTDEATGYSFYRAELLPNSGELSRLNGQPLVPGMPVETLIKTGDRSPLSYLTKPLTDYFMKAFRER
ncbi:HlyD family type I secretion periplasmic adaptor subunit [Thalassobius sp. I31.1]|uniref:HlyD family type I secretion periplasmic adaptor subunit n=1 Tax=Thalassobius sp. I31.1 TaxID=2109912 RepID=UPI000D1B0DAE|nr:HlyD family type I secretion periplasmic adaptor subunit [Thalassobius sp. I31.1]